MPAHKSSMKYIAHHAEKPWEMKKHNVECPDRHKHAELTVYCQQTSHDTSVKSCQTIVTARSTYVAMRLRLLSISIVQLSYCPVKNKNVDRFTNFFPVKLRRRKWNLILLKQFWKDFTSQSLVNCQSCLLFDLISTWYSLSFCKLSSCVHRLCIIPF